MPKGVFRGGYLESLFRVLGFGLDLLDYLVGEGLLGFWEGGE